jgi:hypothetical protein
MSRFAWLHGASLAAVLALCGGCAHTIVIGPDMNRLPVETPPTSSGAAGYYISPENRDRAVTSGGGGGDSVKYTPYKDLEAALFRVLSNHFAQVYSLKSPQDRALMQEKNLHFVFTPQYSTTSSSSSLFTWPPTEFTLTIHIEAVDQENKSVWQAEVSGSGQAAFSEFKRDFGLAAERASEDAFRKLGVKLAEFPGRN